MAVWTEGELRYIGNAQELEIAPVRADDTTRTPRPIWVARAGGDLYVRAAYGSGSAWHRIAREGGRARISAAGAETDITVADAGKAALDQVDTAYREKYGGRYASIVDTINDPEYRATTLRLLPRSKD